MSGEKQREGEPPGSESRPPQSYWLRLYEQYREPVRRYLARHIRCPYDVDDLVQNVFAGLILHGTRLRDPQTYIFAVARHQLFAYQRNRRRSLPLEQIPSDGHDDCFEGVVDDDREANPLEMLCAKEAQRIVHSVVAGLSPALEEALRLTFISGLRQEEVALRVHCSRAALQKRLVRAKQSLGRSLRTRESLLA